MREILFRGKSVFSQKFVEGSLIQYGEYCCILPQEGVLHPMDEPYLDPEYGTFDGKAEPVDPETVGQFTGLKDKNGKRIFEGDIAKIYDAGGYSEIAVVQYGEHGSPCLFDTNAEIGFYLLFAKPGMRNSLRVNLPYWAKEERFEVIGNAYDNPELIGGAK